MRQLISFKDFDDYNMSNENERIQYWDQVKEKNVRETLRYAAYAKARPGFKEY